MQWAKTKNGFTIVELLIVIVVIAILAAITIVSYNGITERTRHASVISAVDAWTKILEMEKIENGSYPASFRQNSTAPLFTYYTKGDTLYACLAAPGSLPAEGNFPADTCLITSTDGGVTYSVGGSMPNDALAQRLASQTNQLPPLPLGGTIRMESESQANQISEVRGVLYVSNETNAVKQAAILYYYKGDHECPRGERSTDVLGGISFSACIVTLK